MQNVYPQAWGEGKGQLFAEGGEWMELGMQVEPDILIYNDPASILRGEDKQLEAAVNEMLRTIDNK